MKNLDSQLNNLKGIKPGADYKSKNRELLFSQIYNSTDAKPADFSFGFFLYVREISADFFNIMAQPAIAVGLIFVFIFGGGLFGAMASRGTKPGDSLYVAKVISEKTQMALTFDEKQKVELRIDFAGNRAEEIDQVLAIVDKNDNEQVKNETKQTVDNLVVNLKKEIGAAKNSLQKISKNANIVTKIEVKEVAVVNKSTTTTATKTEDTEDDVFSANLGIEKSGISTSEKINPIVVKIEDSKTLLDQAKESLKSDDMVSVLTTLNKVDEAIDKKVDSGEVQGVSETASTTELVK